MGKIVSLPVAEGDRVKAGQMLARIDPVPAQSEASSAMALVRALEAEERAASLRPVRSGCGPTTCCPRPPSRRRSTAS